MATWPGSAGRSPTSAAERAATPGRPYACAVHDRPALPAPDGSPLLTVDLYELAMAESYLAEGLAERPATFEVSCRTLPPGWGYLLAAGLGELLEALARLRFDEDVLAYLEETRMFAGGLLERLARFRFGGQVRALPEGSAFFAGQPLLELTAPLIEAQLVETLVLNRLHFPSLVAAKAARCVEAAAGRRLTDFSLRRTQGSEAGLQVARSSYLAGFDSTSNVLAGARYGIPVAGTMAHSYVEAFAEETEAFAAFTRSFPNGATLLIDTYDALEGARGAVAAGLALQTGGGWLGGVRLDSGDLAELSLRVRGLLDEAGLARVSIVASGNLDERAIARLLAAGAPIDGFGVGTRLAAPSDAPSLDFAYKLVSFDGRPVMKLSPGKQTLPGRKQLWRISESGRYSRDVVGLADEPPPSGAVARLVEVMTRGEPGPPETLAAIRARARNEREALRTRPARARRVALPGRDRRRARRPRRACAGRERAAALNGAPHDHVRRRGRARGPRSLVGSSRRGSMPPRDRGGTRP